MRWLLALYPRAWRDRLRPGGRRPDRRASARGTPRRCGPGLTWPPPRPLNGTCPVPACRGCGRAARAPHAWPDRPQSRVHCRGARAGGNMGSWSYLTRHGHTATPAAWEAAPVIVAGVAHGASGTRGGGPWHSGPWDTPWLVVAAGPYRWVRTRSTCRAADCAGGAWLFTSLPLSHYAGVMAVFFHLFVTLRRTDAAAPLRQHLPGVPARGPALDPPPAAPRLTTGIPAGGLASLFRALTQLASLSRAAWIRRSETETGVPRRLREECDP